MLDEKNKIGLIPATLMVAGNMMGSGVFMLPANLAAIGSIAIWGLISANVYWSLISAAHGFKF